MADSRKTLLITGFVICILIAVLIDLFIGLIALVILAAIFMSLRIMADSADLPNISAFLQEDAKGIWVVNRGNATAYSIRVALVPLDLEFTIPKLEMDGRTQFPLDMMVENVKVVVQYTNDSGVEYSDSYKLSALGEDDDDLLKPVFPLFKWK
ncbi:MAG: hypothetical protein APR55_01685 [Methanolinea sp. SDB]|nr:MAG: hypothetical protein APR55_01685 [Methanolinea sp. SDB]